MSILGTSLLPAVELGQVPYWRQVLRGFAQCAFQTNEVAGFAFVAAVAAFSLRIAVFYVIAVILGTATARLLRADRAQTDLGLFGFNSGLAGLALGNFFVPSPVLWLVLLASAVVVAAVAVGWSRWIPVPFLAGPFILCFWLQWLVSEKSDLMRVSFAPFADEDPHGATSILTALGSALFCPAILSGILFLIGLALANWRHAVIAVLGASIAVGLAVTVHVPGGMINSGFVGFNAVLAAVAAYALVSPDLRLVVLAAGLSTWVFVVFVTTSQDPALASGYVVAIWAIMALGWLNSRFTNAESVSDSD